VNGPGINIGYRDFDTRIRRRSACSHAIFQGDGTKYQAHAIDDDGNSAIVEIDEDDVRRKVAFYNMFGHLPPEDGARMEPYFDGCDAQLQTGRRAPNFALDPNGVTEYQVIARRYPTFLTKREESQDPS